MLRRTNPKCRRYLAACCEEIHFGIVEGKDNNRFDPAGNATRFKMMQRLDGTTAYGVFELVRTRIEEVFQTIRETVLQGRGILQ
ncbi:hypothetical protein [Paenibacillus sp. N3.4]|uniref:hypothetical protein n=1 Tax=Paenibacillus sp. N3.4 TaxID=2603222 RepID=UPI00164F9A8C|nr:hypothetical protein [Paenibacillus sp. N3.4]